MYYAAENEKFWSGIRSKRSRAFEVSARLYIQMLKNGEAEALVHEEMRLALHVSNNKKSAWKTALQSYKIAEMALTGKKIGRRRRGYISFLLTRMDQIVFSTMQSGERTGAFSLSGQSYFVLKLFTHDETEGGYYREFEHLTEYTPKSQEKSQTELTRAERSKINRERHREEQKARQR